MSIWGRYQDHEPERIDSGSSAYLLAEYRLAFGRDWGPAISHEPNLEDVLNCIASDTSGCENAQSFEEWASEYGYDTDSRKAERIFNAVATQALALARLLTVDAYDNLLWHTERL